MGESYNSYVERLQDEIDIKAEEGSMIISDPDIWILSAWFSDEGLSLRDKEEFWGAIDQMEQQDPEMHAALKRGNIARMSGIKYEKAWVVGKLLDKADILKGMNTPIEECIPESEVDWESPGEREQL